VKSGNGFSEAEGETAAGEACAEVGVEVAVDVAAVMAGGLEGIVDELIVTLAEPGNRNERWSFGAGSETNNDARGDCGGDFDDEPIASLESARNACLGGTAGGAKAGTGEDDFGEWGGDTAGLKKGDDENDGDPREADAESKLFWGLAVREEDSSSSSRGTMEWRETDLTGLGGAGGAEEEGTENEAELGLESSINGLWDGSDTEVEAERFRTGEAGEEGEEGEEGEAAKENEPDLGGTGGGLTAGMLTETIFSTVDPRGDNNKEFGVGRETEPTLTGSEKEGGFNGGGGAPRELREGWLINNDSDPETRRDERMRWDWSMDKLKVNW
jgi:hypothetical protein